MKEGSLGNPYKIYNSQGQCIFGELFINILLFFGKYFFLCEPKLTTFIIKDQ